MPTLRLPPWQFARLRTRLAVRYGVLFTLALLAVAIVAQVVIQRHARESVRTAMATSGSVYDRLWALRAQSLSESVGVLSRDFGFRAAVASGDKPTISSALAHLKSRAQVADTFLVDTAGDVLGDGAPALREAIGDVAASLPPGRHDAVIADNGGVYRIVATPIMAPTQVGLLVFALPLDRREMDTLEKLSAIPLTATMLHRDRAGHWVGGANRGSDALDALVMQSRGDGGPALLDLPDGRAFALAKPFAGRGDTPEAALLLSYSLDAALASYRGLEIGIALAGLIGLLLVLHGSARLAGSIARPIVALDAAARSLEAGERTEVEVVGSDEIGRLAQSFNRMSAGIIEREHRISHLALHDTLTGLPNRIFFREQLEAILTRAPHFGEQIVVLCLDLDGFKEVNDTLGHSVGDALLKVVGGELGALAGKALIARLDGDEFAIILTGRDNDRPRALAQAIIDRMKAPMVAAGHQIVSGTSIGIAVGPTDGADADALLKSADFALYRAKQDGRGVFRYFEPGLDAAARARRQLELDLRAALSGGQFRLNFQPVYDLKKERIGGFEALLRWEHPTRGEVGPTEFIPIAEDIGLIIAIGEWVLHEACRHATSWPEHIRVAVNVSSLQFRNAGFASILLQALARSGLSPGRLEIEITESVFLDGEAPTIALLHRLREMGVRVALDDFGTGYSSLSYLRSFPFDKIKIDRSFVTSIADDPSAAAIVRAIVNLATALKMETTAEGVENDAQLDELRRQGCGNIQGYLFSRPVEASQVAALINPGGEAKVA